MSGARLDPSVPDYLNQNTSEAGPEVALFNGHSDLNFSQRTLEDTMSPIGSYDTRTITKQTFSKLQMNSKFGTFTKKACESIEKFHSTMDDQDDDDDQPNANNITAYRLSQETTASLANESILTNRTHHQGQPKLSTLNQVSAGTGSGGGGGGGGQQGIKPSALVSPMMALNSGSDGERSLEIDDKVQEDQVSGLNDEMEQLKIQLNDALAERDQAVTALRAYEELLKRVNEANTKQKRVSTSSLGSGSLSQKETPSPSDAEMVKKKNVMLEKTIDNLEQTVQDTMARMNEVKDVNQELKNVLTDQQDMLAQYKSTIEQKSFEYRDLLAKHEAHIGALVTEHKRDKALLEKQITLLRAEAHMKSLDNERLASECRIKGEQLARMTEMLNELRQAY